MYKRIFLWLENFCLNIIKDKNIKEAVDLIQNIDSYVKLSECGNLVKSTNTTAYAGITTSTIFVSNTTGFPDNYGLIKINDEIITYESKTDISFVNCKRGFSGITSFRNPS